MDRWLQLLELAAMEIDSGLVCTSTPSDPEHWRGHVESGQHFLTEVIAQMKQVAG